MYCLLHLNSRVNLLILCSIKVWQFIIRNGIETTIFFNHFYINFRLPVGIICCILYSTIYFRTDKRTLLICLQLKYCWLIACRYLSWLRWRLQKLLYKLNGIIIFSQLVWCDITLLLVSKFWVEIFFKFFHWYRNRLNILFR